MSESYWRNMMLLTPDDGYIFGDPRVGTPAEDCTGLPADAAELYPDDLLRFEIYPPGQPVTMTEPGAVTFLNGASSVTGWLWVNGVRQYMITYDKYAGAVSGYLRPFLSAFVKSLLKAL